METLPSGHVRLLYIEAGVDESDIRCRLVASALEASPPYEALSYTWGSTEQKSPLTCDNHLKLVTKNLYDAIKYLRDSQHERIMWIDAVCIDQNNDRERTEQVSIMKVIYARAFRVVIWLGKENPGDEGAFSILSTFKALFAQHGLVEVTPFPDQSFGFPHRSDPKWTALVRFFQREWFQRIWVVQEATMAREAIFVCGSRSISWSDISNVAQSLRHHGHIGPYPIDFRAPKVPGISCVIVIHFLSESHRSQDSGWTLLSLLRLTRRSLATDPRDKVFALSGIVNSPESVNVKADYSLSTEEVYLSVAIQSLEKLEDLDILGNGGICSAPQNPDLPSWVPDWSHVNDRRSVISPIARNRGMCASGDSQPILSVSADKRILTIRGAIVDTILKVDNTILVGDEDAKLDHGTKAGEARIALRSKAVFLRYLDFSESANKFPDGQDHEESLWRTLCCDMTVQIPPRRAPPEYATAWSINRKQLQAITIDGNFDWSGIDMTEFTAENVTHFASLINSIGVHTTGRNLCVTAGGYLGHVPSGTQIEDKVCILLGSAVPFVLREEENGLFKLVGECYVHGIMDGEAVRGRDFQALCQNFQLQ